MCNHHAAANEYKTTYPSIAVVLKHQSTRKHEISTKRTVRCPKKAGSSKRPPRRSCVSGSRTGKRTDDRRWWSAVSGGKISTKENRFFVFWSTRLKIDRDLFPVLLLRLIKCVWTVFLEHDTEHYNNTEIFRKDHIVTIILHRW